MIRPLAVQLGTFVAGLRHDDLPPSVVDKAKALVNHGMTVGMAGFPAVRAAAARRTVLTAEGLGVRQVGSGQGATLWVDGTRATRVGATFANGVCIAVDQQCDSYRLLTHPGILIIPAALASAEGEGRTGRELLTAVAAGYEVQCRCARDFIPSTQARGFRSSPIYGILGCAATVAKLLALDAEQSAHAIALAASFAASLIEGQRTGAVDSNFADAQAARNGVWAATLAQEGFTGAPTALEGDGGFYNAFTGNNKGELAYTLTGIGVPKADLQDVVSELGRRWEILNVKFKLYPTPGFNQPVIWLAREMMTEHKLPPENIEHITLELNYLETLYPSPRFPRVAAADGSDFERTRTIGMLAYTVVAGDYPVLEHYDPGRLGASKHAVLAADVADMQKRVEVIGVVGRNSFAPRITLRLRDGRRITGEYDGRELMWDFAKDARELRRFVPGLPISPDQYDRLVAAIAKLEEAPSVNELISLTLPA
jgi:2-methylcitrate dehydratase PrpD